MANAPKRKLPIPAAGKRPTRAEILKGINWKPLPIGSLPEAVRKAKNRRMQDEVVAWTLGMWDHMESLKTSAKGTKRPTKRKT
jgi:hypothetical protein